MKLSVFPQIFQIEAGPKGWGWCKLNESASSVSSAMILTGMGRTLDPAMLVHDFILLSKRSWIEHGGAWSEYYPGMEVFKKEKANDPEFRILPMANSEGTEVFKFFFGTRPTNALMNWDQLVPAGWVRDVINTVKRGAFRTVLVYDEVYGCRINGETFKI